MADVKSRYVRRTSSRWADLLGEYDGGRVAADERRRAVLRAIAAGATQAEIARFLGVSGPLIGQMIKRASRHQSPVFHKLMKYAESQDNQALRE